MGRIEDFESTLKEVVQAKRLSASKMTKLTEIALKSMKDDTQLVSILYRTHKSLSASAKVSSLYVFDALARAAKHQANKQHLVGDINSPEGNCATFLLKVEGVLEGLFKDMILVGTPEAKEKTKKVLDIWVKGNTFRPAILSQLADVLKAKDIVKEPSRPVVSSDPRKAAQPSVSSTPPSIATPPSESSSAANQPSTTSSSDPQSTILALLTQAVNAGANTNQQTSTNTSVSPAGPQLDVAQLALLQQLTQTAQIGSNLSYPGAAPAPVHSDVDRVRSSYANEALGPASYAGEHFNHSSGSDHFHDGRGGSRVYRGVRGRWNEGRGNRDGRDHFRDRDQRAKHSRSRSPPSRYGARREIKPYSPPRRPSLAAVRESSDTGESQSSAGNTDKDEFGRDRRAQSPESLKEATPPTLHEPSTTSTSSSSWQSSSATPNVASTSAGTEAEPVNVNEALPGLDQFNVALFDFTSPAAWEALGKMWLVTFGTMPTTEQLMQFVMVSGTSTDPSQMSQGWAQPGWASTESQHIADHEGAFVGPGRGGLAHGSQMNPQGQLGLGTWNASGDPRIRAGAGVGSSGSNPAGDYTSQSSKPGEKRGGGQMQRVGDKWVFVRDNESGVS